MVRRLLVAARTSASLTIVPMALYVGLIVWSGDLGGPLNLVIIPFVSVIIGFVVGLTVFTPVSSLAESPHIQRWLQVVGGLLVALTTGVVLAWISVGSIKSQHRVYLVAVSVCTYFVGGFFVYLCCLAECLRKWPSSSSELHGPARIG